MIMRCCLREIINLKSMRYLLLIIGLIWGGITVSAQGKLNAEKWKEFEAQKIAFFTQELDLSPEDAAVFWPLYNEMQKKIKAVEWEIRSVFKELKEPKNLKEEDYKRAVEKGLAGEIKIGKLKEEYYTRILNVIPASKVWRLRDAERKFHRQLFDKLRRASFPKK